MEMLYSIFEKDPPLDIQLSAYAARVAVILLQKKVTEVKKALLVLFACQFALLKDFLKFISGSKLILL
jgi:hypothetical protein